MYWNIVVFRMNKMYRRGEEFHNVHITSNDGDVNRCDVTKFSTTLDNLE